VDVVGIDPLSVIELVSGTNHTCALTSANQVYCWGLNSSGQLGDGTTGNRNRPVLVSGLEGTIVSISAGAEFTCALNSANDLYCWGSNTTGQLNDGTEENRSTPVEATEVSNVVLISGGSEELQGITADGAVELWNTQPIVPVTGLPNEGNEYVSADRFATGGCTLTNGGTVECWGEIVNASVSDALISEMLASGAAHACTMKAEGLVCWGSNSNGQLGDGTFEDKSVDVPVIDLEKSVIALAAGAKHTCVILGDETVKCWGQNEFGQLGNGANVDSNKPVVAE
jgi:alpha-tubulin suppressor-like RCC1 family protein